MANAPFFSVIIPTYNRAPFIMKSVEAVLAQSFPDFELIIVDDGSTDNTQQLLTRITDSRVRVFKKDNEERGAARNFGTMRSAGNYVTFLDSDDLIYSQHLEIVYTELKRLNYPEFFHQSYEIRDEAIAKSTKIILRKEIINNLLFTQGNVMSCMGIFLTREVAVKNLFVEDRVLSGLEDWELWIRLSAQFSIHHDDRITGALIQHRERSVSTIKREALIKSATLLLEYVDQNKNVREKYFPLMKRFRSNVYSYVSLQLSEMPSSRLLSSKYLIKSIVTDVGSAFRRRTLAIIRNLTLRYEK